MIESEEKRIRLTKAISRWCDLVKATPLLRSGDVSSLVEQILEEFYHITLSCGHKVRDMSEAEELEFEDFITDRSDMEHGDGMGTVYGSYCADCAKRYKKELHAKPRRPDPEGK